MFEKRKRKQEQKTKKEKLNNLVEAALGDSGLPKEIPEDKLLEAVQVVVEKVKEQQVEIKKQELPNNEINTIKPVTETAYNIVYKPETKQFILCSVQYVPGTVKEEIFATSFPEVNYKLGKLFLDKLLKTVYGR